MGSPDLPKIGTKLSPRGFTITEVSQSRSFKRVSTRDWIFPRSLLLSLNFFSYLLASSAVSVIFAYQQRFCQVSHKPLADATTPVLPSFSLETESQDPRTGQVGRDHNGWSDPTSTQAGSSQSTGHRIVSRQFLNIPSCPRWTRAGSSPTFTLSSCTGSCQNLFCPYLSCHWPEQHLQHQNFWAVC